MDESIIAFIEHAIKLAEENVNSGKGGPFAAIVVKNGEIIAEGVNTVTTTNDPTAHAEVNAIRNACKVLNTFQLTGCELYSSCEPCPMCLGAIYWSRPDRIFYAASKDDASRSGFDDSFIYKEILKADAQRSIPFVMVETKKKLLPFQLWNNSSNKIEY